MTDVPPPPRLRFVPDRRFTAGAGVGLLAAVVALLLAHDGPGRLFAGVVLVVLLCYLVGDLWFSPRLEVSGAGLVIRSPLTRATLAWSEVDDVRADVTVRHGLRSTTLEIDAGPVLAVLSRRALGADPQQAAELVRAFRPLS